MGYAQVECLTHLLTQVVLTSSGSNHNQPLPTNY
jgi:hypothetical protein